MLGVFILIVGVDRNKQGAKAELDPNVSQMDFDQLEWRSPVAAFCPLAGQFGAHLFASPNKMDGQRWSFICAFPSAELVIDKNRSYLNGSLQNQEALTTLQAFFRVRSQLPTLAGRAPFKSGIAGYVGYDVASIFEHSMTVSASPYNLPDLCLGSYEAVACFEHSENSLRVYGRSECARKALAEALGKKEDVRHPAKIIDVRSNQPRKEYEAKIQDIRSRIKIGDFYQANLSQLFELEFQHATKPFDIFRDITRDSSSPFAAILQYQDGAIVSNSPERFFSICVNDKQRRILAEPIKGTRPRSFNAEEDERLRNELLQDEKDRAENIMILDLLRNDLSKICEDFSIVEDLICGIKTFSYVHHLVSKVSGILKSEITNADVLSALFPCGSITGAPKIEAMKVIDELESTGRGPYCGAIGYFDDSGGADLSVAIRTVIFPNAEASSFCQVASGGGITYLSDPSDEYHETVTKLTSTVSSAEKLIW